MNMTALTVFKTALTATALTLAMAGSAAASWVGGDNVLGLGETITNTSANGNKQGWTGNSALVYDAWGMQGSWLTFNLTSKADTVVSATAQVAGKIAPAFTLYRTNVSWTGSSVPGQLDSEHGDGSEGIIHDFSQVAQARQSGLIWATANTPGGAGVVETLGYANSGNSYASNSFGQEVKYGANDVSIDNLFESAIIGSVGTGFANLKLSSLAAGWYTLFVSGADASSLGGIGGKIDVSVAAIAPVPVPGAVWLFGSALVGLIGTARRKLSA